MGNGKEQYAPGTERVLVFALGDQPLLNHDGSPCNDVLQFPSTRKSYKQLGQHLFEKPTALMERLVAKHSHPGKIVVEPFGGTGPASVAAARLKRRWLYCESNRRNFELGSSRVADELTKLTNGRR